MSNATRNQALKTETNFFLQLNLEPHSSYRMAVKYLFATFTPTLIIIDSQAVKNTCNASVKSKGFCTYKATNGIKRHEDSG